MAGVFQSFIFLYLLAQVIGFGYSLSGEASVLTDTVHVFKGESYETKLEFLSLLVDFYKLLNHAERDMTPVYFITLASSRTVAFNSELTGYDCLLEEWGLLDLAIPCQEKLLF